MHQGIQSQVDQTKSMLTFSDSTNSPVGFNINTFDSSTVIVPVFPITHHASREVSTNVELAQLRMVEVEGSVSMMFLYNCINNSRGKTSTASSITITANDRELRTISSAINI